MDFREVSGKCGITATVVADSVNVYGDRLTTMTLQYPRMIHAEFLRHRMFSNSVSSSRAIPVEKMVEQVTKDPAMPVYWGKNQAGMSAEEEHSAEVQVNGAYFSPEEAWKIACDRSASIAKSFATAGYHKQIVNRMVEPWQFINQVVSATDFENFFYLRIDSAAQPEIQELATVMYKAMATSDPVLRRNSAHLPFITNEDRDRYDEEACTRISASMCAQQSYRKSDKSLDKANMIYKRLIDSRPIHASPFEMVAMPFSEEEYMARVHCRDTLYASLVNMKVEKHVARQSAAQVMYAGNYKGWRQARMLIEDNTYTGAL
ncbi:MAG: hypothetical protein DRQ39_05855 [Gammaproteobacteria bacterium]|nr:MAG: hypothetical protein DRQ39_05855 [Gammaproteobacteria bacterium]